tara:strand:+ start:8592 stop:9932 length:1341 start_codon:yes stop_codon:yes gene_type:complete
VICPRFAIRVAILLCAAITVACGMRGPPRPPEVILPGRVVEFEVQRFGNEIYLEFLVPDVNSDGSQPADLELIEIYALTTQPESDEQELDFDDWLVEATLVRTIEIVSDNSSEPVKEDTGSEDKYLQGEMVVFSEMISEDILVPFFFADEEEVSEISDEEEVSESSDETLDNMLFETSGNSLVAGPLVSPSFPRSLQRTYRAIGVSSRGREGSPSSSQKVSLGPRPDVPGKPEVSYGENDLSIEWTIPVNARLPVQTVIDDQVLPAKTLIPPQMPSVYQVYEVSVSSATITMPEAINPEPLLVNSYVDTEIEFGVERCFAVRTRDVVDQIDQLEVHSDLSDQTCIAVIDTFPPAPPTGLVAVAGEEVISLAWSPNSESDIAGYIVSRSDEAGGIFVKLTNEPVEATNYRDTDVEPGRSYLYVVHAVDNAEKHNISLPSEEVEERMR